MKILNKYIYKELIAPFFFGVAAFTGIFIGTDLIFELTEYYTRWGVEVFTLIRLFFLSLPEIIVLTFPMASLLGTIMAYNRLSGDSEITAMRAGGVSIISIVLPALIMGLVTSGVTIGITEFLVPRANYRAEQIMYQARHGEQRPETQYDLFLTPMDSSTRRPDYMLYAHSFNGDSGVMKDVVVQSFENGSPDSVLEAKRAEWLSDGWHFYNGTIYFLDAEGRRPALEFDSYRSREEIHSPGRAGQLGKNIDEMNIRELSEQIALMEEQGRTAYEERVELHHRFSIPLASFIFALLAAPLGIKPQRSAGSATGFGISIIIIFIYYVLMTVGDALGSQGTIQPWLGAWLQNIVIFIVGVGMLIKTARQ
ncbi:lipopolysaccharide export system permease protein [Halanaerobium saccharolyticum]|uniref:Lipopolysaccharide export system permease protein n=1 Tax=Halanaerobium saccharolyticum TaxID=43595 RepID=A0A4R6M543_9FIRM|nr:LptF/LptG family permease [Halanaerobium saccharolyticum]TDO95109.1 lipopolysaccharide export system permease protein [Halanaerobium saccharolyticum]